MPASDSRLAAQPPDAPEPTTITSNVVGRAAAGSPAALLLLRQDTPLNRLCPKRSNVARGSRAADRRELGGKGSGAGLTATGLQASEGPLSPWPEP